MVIIITFSYSTNDSRQNKDSKVAGENPQEVGEGNTWEISGYKEGTEDQSVHVIITNTGPDHQRFPAEPVTETSNDGTGDELEEGEEGAEKSPEQDVVKVSRSSNKTSEQVNLGR